MDVDSGSGGPNEPLSDWPLALVAMVGGVGGALIGATNAANANAAFPLVWMVVGTMIGSGLCVLAWCLLDNRSPLPATE